MNDFPELERKFFDDMVEQTIKMNAPFFNENSIYGAFITKDYLVGFVPPNLCSNISRVEGFIAYEDYPESLKIKYLHGKKELGAIGNIRFYVDDTLAEDNFNVLCAGSCEEPEVMGHS